jgi:hypothetical protein
MKKILLISILILLITNVNAQAPRGPNGSSLYKKGGCERVSAKFVSCTYCEDKELTKNCKEYWCTDDGTCTEAPLKKNNDQLMRTNADEKKVISIGENDTTSKLPRGVKLVKGKITVQEGYKAVSSSDKKTVFLISSGGNGVHGGFRCECDSSPGSSCNTSVINNKIVCGGDSCCKIVVTIYDGDNITMQQAEANPEKLKWRKLVLPTKSN